MKKGSIIVEVLLMMILVVAISAILLLLIKTNVIDVKADNQEQEPILNTEFIPLGREGYLAVKEFQFCRFVDQNYNCINELDRIPLGADVHFLFVVESSTTNGKAVIAENYKVKDPSGTVLLDVDSRNDFYFETTSEKTTERITFKDYFVTDVRLPEGVYTIELHLENPLLAKTTKLTKQVELYRK